MQADVLGKAKAVEPEEKLEGKEAILAVLARAADDSDYLARLADNPTETLNEYYTLTQEEIAALVSGDLRSRATVWLKARNSSFCASNCRW